jgi:hypothetical protein
MTSPTLYGELPAAVTPVGGIVLDLIGLNGSRVVSEQAADTLFVGTFLAKPPAGTTDNPGLIGVQRGFTPAVVALLGGGLREIAVRVTLFDGDNAPGEFDYHEDYLLLNGLSVGDFSGVATEATSMDGKIARSANPAGGFRSDLLDTGFFFSADEALLSQLWNSLKSSGEVVYQFFDRTPGDNFVNFAAGVDGSEAPTLVVAPPAVATPATPGAGAQPASVAPLSSANSLAASQAPLAIALLAPRAPGSPSRLGGTQATPDTTTTTTPAALNAIPFNPYLAGLALVGGGGTAEGDLAAPSATIRQAFELSPEQLGDAARAVPATAMVFGQFLGRFWDSFRAANSPTISAASNTSVQAVADQLPKAEVPPIQASSHATHGLTQYGGAVQTTTLVIVALMHRQWSRSSATPGLHPGRRRTSARRGRRL